MTVLHNPVQLCKLLNQSNCRLCGESTCMAFAAAVVRGDRQLEECPYLDRETIQNLGGETKEKNEASSSQEEMEKTLQDLKQKISSIDFNAAATRTGGIFDGKKITLKVLGEDFHVDTAGQVSSRIHTNLWVTIPVLAYILYASGAFPKGEWITFRDLQQGMSWYGLFEQRCLSPLKNIAENYTELFVDFLEIFQGKRLENELEADISYMLYPLPKVPILFCYWEPEEEFESKFNIYFDKTIESNLNMESIFSITTGLGTMFDALVQTHVPKPGK